MADLFRQSVYSGLAGYEDVNDAVRLSQSPTFRLVRSARTWDPGAELLTRPVGQPSHRPLVRHNSFRYQAERWKTARRVMAKVEFHARELFPRVGFLVTNLESNSRVVGRFCN